MRTFEMVTTALQPLNAMLFFYFMPLTTTRIWLILGELSIASRATWSENCCETFGAISKLVPRGCSK
ncbi:hypothetical protein BJY04DRAFT_187746 [Aspergillus karnatakaensis]|uniref:uncharacterized protein n=1 Tax=Aspergillus karnatakaensis TaxID=1810916 RepID=UPI003CCCCFE0